MLIYLR
jgi:hypothetical protein